MRPLIDLAYRARRRLLALTGWATAGAKVMVHDRSGRLLLVRNRYGRTDRWVLPGGGIKRRESPQAAGAREVLEETGCRVTGMEATGVFQSKAEGRRDTVHLFSGVTDDTPVPDGVEIAEARFFALDALPKGLSPATRRRLDEIAGRRQPDGRW
ncbi:8-oxo-dGTP pyrophosphatase MutT (NUDIX family) [Sphingomonas jejuensis]|uniref:8-oxo-dGTP pyrophosphatase MutT (NUDIX family) n=1 Tax=Sphingomonas jejuensis TaxID=904715 RepID=A0ABX0XIC0_9SPHN|nr:NUDIX domain-containing protein [Sphingomonas jejuensis]NJC33074.1 8-oxo-dGTP pyrophosphatase MutT (NUDIX family) [Sphingomonas jejuensis]